MATRPLMLWIGYDRMDEEHRRAAEARLQRGLPDTVGREERRLRLAHAIAASAASAARALRAGHHRSPTIRPG